MMRVNLSMVAMALLTACVTSSQAAGDATAYGRALEGGNLDEAYALTSISYRARVSREAFGRRWADEASRREHALAIAQAVEGLESVAPELGVASAPSAPHVEQAREAVRAFVAAVSQGDFTAAYELLAPALRARYTPEQLGVDFSREPAAKARLERALWALRRPPLEEGERVRFPVGAGSAVEVVRERTAWRLAALE